MPFHAQRECLDPTQGEERIEGTGHATDRVLQIRELLAQLIGAVTDDGGAADRIRVAVQIFRRRVHDEIETVLQRVLQIRRRERVVAHREDAALLRDRRDGRQIDDLQQRIGRRLHPDQSRVRLQRRFERVGIREIDERDVMPGGTLAHVLEQAIAAAIQIVHGDDVRAAVEQIDDRRRRREPRSERETRRATFEIGDARLERIARRIRRARILVALVLARARLHERRRRVDRRHDRAGQRIRLLPAVNDAGAEAVFLSSSTSLPISGAASSTGRCA